MLGGALQVYINQDENEEAGAGGKGKGGGHARLGPAAAFVLGALGEEEQRGQEGVDGDTHPSNALHTYTSREGSGQGKGPGHAQ